MNLVANIKGNNSKYGDLPIFVISNTASEEKVNSYLELGVSKYYTKADHSLSDIIEDIKKALSKK